MANTIISLNQIIKLFSDFVEAHPQLNDFGFGSTSEIGTSRQMEFPYCWVTFEQDSNLEISPNKSITPEMSFTILMVDQLNQQTNYQDINGENSDNGQEVLSDAFQYGQDLINDMVSYWSQYGISIPSDVSVYPILDETDDKVNGWAFRVSVKLKYFNCATQVGTVTIQHPTEINYLTCDTVGDCPTIQNIEASLAAICDTIVDCPVIQTIQTDITNIEADIIALSGATGGLTCEELSGCTTIQTIQTDITNLSGDVVTNTVDIANLSGDVITNITDIANLSGDVTTNITDISNIEGDITTINSTLTGLTTNFYIGVNFQTTDAFTYVAPESFKINTVDNPDALTYTITVNGGAYTLGNTIALYDDVVVTPTTIGFLKLNCQNI